MTEKITSITLDVPEAQLTDLRARLSTIRWPEGQTVTDTSQGPTVDKLRTLTDHWRDSYDWRAVEAELNGWGQYRTTIDGLDIDFLHIRSPEPDALPLVLTHGWPGSVLEFRHLIGPLSDPAAHGGDPRQAFHLVIPTLPGFGFSAKPAETGWTIPRIARAWITLMDRLGYQRWGAQGGDFGCGVTDEIARSKPAGLVGTHLNFAMFGPTPDEVADATPQERAALASTKDFFDEHSGYMKEQSTRPQTIGYSLADSPVGLAAWIYTMFQDLCGTPGNAEGSFTLDEMLDDIMLYWLPNSGASAARLYWELTQSGWSSLPRDHRAPDRGTGRLHDAAGREDPEVPAPAPAPLRRHRLLRRACRGWPLLRPRAARRPRRRPAGDLRPPPLTHPPRRTLHRPRAAVGSPARSEASERSVRLRAAPGRAATLRLEHVMRTHDSGTTLVMGARGSVGRHVLAELVAAGVPVRASVRRPAPGRVPADVAVVAADLGDRDSLRAAFDGAEQVFTYADHASVHGVIESARAAGVQRLVVLSSGSVIHPTSAGNAISERHRAVEEAFAAADDLTVVPIRPLVLATNALWWSRSFRETGTVPLYRPDALTAPVHERDVAAVAVAALTGHAAPAVSGLLTGPARTSQRAQVAAVAEAVERDVSVRELSCAAAFAQYRRFVSAEEAEAVLQFLDDAAAGNSPATPTVQQVLGRPATGFDEWAREHADDFRQSPGT